MKLPENFVAEHKPLTDGSTCRGVPLSELTRDELLAVIGYCQQQSAQDKKSRDGAMSMFDALRHARFGNERTVPHDLP